MGSVCSRLGFRGHGQTGVWTDEGPPLRIGAGKSLREARKERSLVTFNIRGVQVEPCKFLKYLGITIASRLMPNIGEPSSSKRMLLNNVLQSLVLRFGMSH
nr:unnamed protein product [Callosobruchus chinensis]